ncbi:TPA: hypothetical protein ACP2QR_005150, partial [Escherichia coli]
FRSEPQQNVKKGIRGWSRRSDNRRAFSAVIDVAVNYFGFDPIHPESSFRNIDFNRIMSVLHNLGYFVCAPEVNKIIEILTSMKEIEELETCAKCKRPYIVPYYSLPSVQIVVNGLCNSEIFSGGVRLAITLCEWF